VIRNLVLIVVGAYLMVGFGFNSVANAQSSIAFVPGIGFIPSGATMTVTPAVSADRRYVRLSVQPFFNSLNGFTNFSIPGAVSGGFGGFGGFGGMNGVVAGGGVGGAGGGVSPGAAFGLAGEPRAGPVPLNDVLAELGPPRGDPLSPSAVTPSSTGPDPEGLLDPEAAIAPPASERAGERTGIRAADQQHPRQRRTAPRKSTPRRSSAAKRRPR
jgi:hypothetical protein